MSNAAQDPNTVYLMASLAWLRSHLQRLADKSQVTAATLTRQKKAMQAAEDSNPPPAIVQLRHVFGLSPFEESILFLCVAVELDTAIASLCAQAPVNNNRPYPTFALCLSLIENPVWDVLLPGRPLRYWRLIEVQQTGATPLIVSPLKADERIVNYFKGLNELDDRLSDLLLPLKFSNNNSSSSPPLAPSQQQTSLLAAHYLESNLQKPQLPLIQLLGSDTPSKKQIAYQVVSGFGLPLYRLFVELLPLQTAELKRLVRLWEREHRLNPIAVYLDAQVMTGTAQNSEVAVALRYLLTSSSGMVFLDATDRSLSLDRATLTLEVTKPTPIEQRDAWINVLGDAASENPSLLASQFNLNLPDIETIAQTILQQERKPGVKTGVKTGAKKSALNPAILQERLWQDCLLRTQPRLDTLAQRLDTKATWDDLVLPEEQMNLLQQIADQVQQRSQVYDNWGFRKRMNRGLGVNALFAGDSGTGKTMAAEAIANTLQLHLYRIDLASVVSKYIGETEKNLRRLFDAAEDGGAILFFDEADALFGKRSQVKDSHDRYSNIEINYLLQRIEAFRGLAILATNLKSSIDRAFLRRLRFIVNFPYPSLEYRKRLWQKVFPPEMPLANLDYDHLGRLNLTGGNIHTIAINAAFLAAREGTKVGMPQILTAARAEFRKLERQIYEADFKWEE